MQPLYVKSQCNVAWPVLRSLKSSGTPCSNCLPLRNVS